MVADKVENSILLLGANGLLASVISPYLLSVGGEVFLHSRDEGNSYCADLTDLSQAQALFQKVKPDIVINLVANANVDACEEPQQAYLGNVKTVENIVSAIKCREQKSHLIHISTDHVYDGAGYHAEHDIILSNYYAFSKYAGELAAQAIDSCVLRTNFFGKGGAVVKESFTDWLFRSMQSGDQIYVFDDVYFNPIAMPTLAEKLIALIKLQPKGTFNLGTRGGMSKADFAFMFAEEMGLPTRYIKKISIDNVSFIKTYRPKGMQMHVSKIEGLLGENMPTLESEIKRVVKDYKNA
jgi:dTDP-4-dehydrorhamnose reductase